MNYWGGESDGPRARITLDERSWTPPHDGFFATDAFTDYAIEFLNEAKAKGQPFLLYLAYNAPHWPLHAPPEDVEQYRGTYDAGWQATRQKRHRRMVELGIIPADTAMAPMDSRSSHRLDASSRTTRRNRLGADPRIAALARRMILSANPRRPPQIKSHPGKTGATWDRNRFRSDQRSTATTS